MITKQGRASRYRFPGSAWEPVQDSRYRFWLLHEAVGAGLDDLLVDIKPQRLK